MNKFKIILLRDYAEDYRHSMNVYGDNLLTNLRKYSTHENIKIGSYLPFFPGWLKKIFLNSTLIFRYARYVSYPWQVVKKSADLFHILDQSYAHLLNFIYLKPGIVTVHDLIPILSWKGLIPGLTYPHFPRLFMLGIRSLKKASAIVAVSESTKNDLIIHCGIDPKKIFVIHNGIDPNFYPIKNTLELRRSLGFPGGDVTLVLITGIQKYKNHLTSVRAIERLEKISKRTIQLIWLGGANYYPCPKLDEAISKLNIKPILLGHVSVEDLNKIYNSVDYLLFPSWYEGFGWPPLEAMSCGLPVITSNVSSIPEIVGDAAITLSPDDFVGFADAIQLLIDNPTLRNNYISKGYLNIKRFSWENNSKKMLDLYKKFL